MPVEKVSNFNDVRLYLYRNKIQMEWSDNVTYFNTVYKKPNKIN